MIQISEYLIGKGIKNIKYTPSIKEKIKDAKEKASKKGLELIFRDRKMNTGDFCFFIYDKKKQKSYLVGYDGYWDEKSKINFDYCLGLTLKYIEDYNK